MPTAQAQAKKRIVVGYLPIASALPFFVAARRGFFKDAGAAVELVRYASAPRITEALLAGRIDATATGTGALGLALAAHAVPGLFAIVAANISSAKSVLDEIIVASGAPYKRVADLKGKRIACEAGPQARIELKAILVKAGIGDDATIVPLAQTEHIAAIVGGTVEAAYTYEPNGTVGKANGVIDIIETGVRSKYLLDDPLAPWYGGAAVVSTDFAGADKGLLSAYLSAMKRGVTQTRNELATAREAYPDYTPFDLKLALAIPAIAYTAYDEFKPAELAAFQRSYDFYFARGILAQRFDVAAALYRR